MLRVVRATAELRVKPHLAGSVPYLWTSSSFLGELSRLDIPTSLARHQVVNRQLLKGTEVFILLLSIKKKVKIRFKQNRRSIN